MRPWSWVVAALLAGALDAGVARAQEECAEDVKQLCADVKPGDWRLSDCLRSNVPKLSPACRGRLEADDRNAKQQVADFYRACGADLQERCGGVEPGEGRLLACLAEHRPELSTACRAESERLSAARARVDALRRACGPDVNAFCQAAGPGAGSLLECLQANEQRLSAECRATDIRGSLAVAGLVGAAEEMTRKERVREALEILQGLDSVAFTRSQVLLQYDSFRKLAGTADASRLLFNPQLVFGEQNQFAFQVKVPVNTVFLADGRGQYGMGNVATTLAWGFDAEGQLRQYLSLGVLWDSSAIPALSSNVVLQPAYALAVRLAKGLSLTTQVVWLQSVTATTGRADVGLLILEPILVANLPGRSFLVLDTKLGWNTVNGTFVPVLKGAAGLFTDRQKSLSITAWYQASLTDVAAAQTFDYAVGLGLAWYFDW